jgi:hypothetical protein
MRPNEMKVSGKICDEGPRPHRQDELTRTLRGLDADGSARLTAATASHWRKGGTGWLCCSLPSKAPDRANPTLRARRLSVALTHRGAWSHPRGMFIVTDAAAIRETFNLEASYRLRSRCAVGSR